MSHNPLSKHTLPYPCSPKDTLPPTFSPMSNSLPTPTPATNHSVDEVVFVGGHGGTNNLMINKINHPSKFVKSKYKIGLVGTYCSGKSSLAHRFAQGSFSDEYRMSLKFNSFSKTVQLEDCLFLKLELIDTLGSAPSIRHQQQHFKDLDAVLLLYDITNEQSFCKLEEFLGQLREHLGQKTLLALVGTHCDQPFKREVTYQEAMRLKKRSGFSLLYEVSSSSGENVAQLFHDLAKYLLILNNYREKEENPQTSTNYEEEKQAISQPSRIVLLEKKLAYKEEECRNLWKDYQAALCKIEALETRNLFESSYVLNYANDPQDFSLKNSKMQHDSKGTYSQRLSEIEQEHAISLQNANRKADEYREKAQRLSQELKKMTAQLNIIEKIIEDQELSFKEILERKSEQLGKASLETLHLNQRISYLSSIVEQQIKHRSQQKIASDSQISLLQSGLSQHLQTIQKLQTSNTTLSFQKEQYIQLLQQSESLMLHYRGQASQKELLQAELSLEEQKCIKMQLHYKQDIAHMKQNYEKIIANLRREKESILQGNSKVVNKIIESKVNEIKLIRSFIDEMETKKECKPNPTLLQSKNANDQKIREFFSYFLDLLKENSQYVLFNLEQLEGSLEEVEHLVGGMIEQVSKFDLTQLLYDVKEKEGLGREEQQEMSHRQHQIWLMVNMESEKRVAKLVAGLQELQGRVGENSQDLRSNISHISQSLGKIEQLSEMGIEAYVESLQN